MTALRSLSREEFDTAWASRPATRLGRYLLFPGGRVTRLSRWEQLLFATGLKTSTTNHERSARL